MSSAYHGAKCKIVMTFDADYADLMRTDGPEVQSVSDNLQQICGETAIFCRKITRFRFHNTASPGQLSSRFHRSTQTLEGEAGPSHSLINA